jgi:hypothetical protein
MPDYGLTDDPPLPWEWARYRLERSSDYWLSTVRSNGAPHLVKVWGVWTDRDDFVFSGAPTSVKIRNVQRVPRASVGTEDGDEMVVVEGSVIELTSDRVPGFIAAYNVKYDVLDPGWGTIDDSFGPFWLLSPQRAFGCIETDHRFTATMTRWTW